MRRLALRATLVSGYFIKICQGSERTLLRAREPFS
jgi:hypothetical protein